MNDEQKYKEWLAEGKHTHIITLHSSHPALRESIQNQLRKTHNLKLCYDWVFEFWELKE